MFGQYLYLFETNNVVAIDSRQFYLRVIVQCVVLVKVY